MMSTIIGIADIAKAKANNEGGQNFVNNQITISEKRFPKTGKAFDKATF